MKTPQLPEVNWQELFGKLQECIDWAGYEAKLSDKGVFNMRRKPDRFDWTQGVFDEASLRLSFVAWQNLNYLIDTDDSLTTEQAERINRMIINIERMQDAHAYTINGDNQYVLKDEVTDGANAGLTLAGVVTEHLSGKGEGECVSYSGVLYATYILGDMKPGDLLYAKVKA